MNTLEILRRKTIIDPITGCWLWKGYRTRVGYGRIGVGKNNTELVHRIAYKLLVEEPKGLVLHKQLCPNKNCWNPKHLYDGDQSDNMFDRQRIHPIPKQTHCKRGHEFTKENTRIYSGVKSCRICHGMRQKGYDLHRKIQTRETLVK